jgi:hypothetical protein
MNFLAPSFALFTLLFAVPIAIHLIGRRRARVRRFAALELLLRSERRVARRTRVRQLLLLALRALAIAAVPLILAKPFVEAQSDLPATVGGAQSAVIVLDDSASMSYGVGRGRLLDEAKARARRIVAALGADADAALVLGSRGGGAPVPQLTADRARLERAIAEVQPTARATDLTAALKRAAQILQNAARPPEGRRVYLVSDLAAHGFEPDAPWAAGRGPELIPVDIGDGARLGNRAVTDVRVEPAAHLGPRGVRVAVEVANFSDEAVKELPVTLRVDGKPVAKGLLDVAPRQKATKHFFHTFSRSDDSIGVHDVVAELAPDALPDDDRRYARVEVRRALRVLLVDGDPRNARRTDEVFYLETALRPGDRDDSQLDVTVATPDDLPSVSTRLGEFDVLYLCNVKAPIAAAPLREFVARGGGLFIALGDNVDPDAYNAALGDLLVQPLASIRVAPEGARLARPAGDRAHPVVASLAPSKKEDPFGEARFFRYALFRPTAAPSVEDRQVVLHFADGAPALLDGKIGAGRVMVFAATLDRDWTDLPIQPIFLPLVQQATRYLARAPLHEAEAALLVGQRYDIPLAAGDARAVVRLPSGRERPYERLAGRRALGFSDTDEPGVYRVSTAGADGTLKPRPQASFVVNLDPAESDLQRVTAERLAQLRAGGGAPPGAHAPRRRVELWHAMGAALLLLLLGEALLLRRK